MQGNVREAMKLYRRWEKLHRNSKVLSMNAINCALEANETEQAAIWIQRAKDNGCTKEVERIETRLLRKLNRTNEAEARIVELMTKYPYDIDIKLDAGQFFYLNGKKEKSKKIFMEVLARDSTNKKALSNVITINGETGNYSDLDELIGKLSSEDIKHNLIKGAIAYTMMGRQKMQEAERLFSELCQEQPEQPLHWLNRCACLKSLKYTNMAKRVARMGLSIHPNYKDLRHALSQCYAELGQYRQSFEIIKEAYNPDTVLSTQQMYNIQFVGEGYRMLESCTLQRIARAWESNQIKEYGISNIGKDRINDKHKERKIRIGYLSTDFCNHPVGRFILPVLRSHNKQTCDIYALSSGNIKDTISNEIKNICTGWIDIGHKSNIEAARIISDMNLDILVEMNGYTSGSRLGILIERPALVQLSYLGYFAPTYLECIDGWIGDAYYLRT